MHTANLLLSGIAMEKSKIIVALSSAVFKRPYQMDLEPLYLCRRWMSILENRKRLIIHACNLPQYVTIHIIKRTNSQMQCIRFW